MTNTPKLPEHSEPMESIRSLLERHKSKEDTEWVSQRLFDIFIVVLNKSKSGIIARELATLTAQVRKEIEELKVDEYGENGNYCGCGAHNGSGECCRNETITYCLSIPSLKEASNE